MKLTDRTNSADSDTNERSFSCFRRVASRLVSVLLMTSMILAGTSPASISEGFYSSSSRYQKIPPPQESQPPVSEEGIKPGYDNPDYEPDGIDQDSETCSDWMTDPTASEEGASPANEGFSPGVDNPDYESVIECGMEAGKGDLLYEKFNVGLKALETRANQAEGADEFLSAWKSVDTYCMAGIDQAMMDIAPYLSKEQTEALKASQDAWLKYRDTQTRVLNMVHDIETNGPAVTGTIAYWSAMNSRTRALAVVRFLIGKN